jgi:hypothetical protein
MALGWCLSLLRIAQIRNAFVGQPGVRPQRCRRVCSSRAWSTSNVRTTLRGGRKRKMYDQGSRRRTRGLGGTMKVFTSTKLTTRSWKRTARRMPIGPENDSATTRVIVGATRELDDSTRDQRWWWRIALPICVVLLVVSWWTIAIGKLQESSRHDLYGLLGHTDSGGQTFWVPNGEKQAFINLTLPFYVGVVLLAVTATVGITGVKKRLVGSASWES